MLKRALRALLSQKVFLILLGMIIIISVASPVFLTLRNITNLFIQASILGIMAFGMTFAIICGEFDLSIGSVMALCGVISVLLQRIFSIGLAIIIVLLIGIVIGLFNGFLIGKLKVYAFITTLGGMVLFKGIALTLSDGSPVLGTNEIYENLGNGSLFGVIPYIVICFLLSLLISEFVLKKTKFGRNLYATGGSYEVAKYAGIKVDYYKMIIFVITAFTAAIGGILMSARLSTGSATHGDTATLNVISSVVIGGTSLSGGEGSALRTLQGLMIFAVLDNAMSLLNIYSYYQLAFKGILLILIIGLDSYYQSRK